MFGLSPKGAAALAPRRSPAELRTVFAADRAARIEADYRRAFDPYLLDEHTPPGWREELAATVARLVQRRPATAAPSRTANAPRTVAHE